MNVAARLMAKAPPRAIYATAAVVAHSPTRFAETTLAPLVVKGKTHPVETVAIGPALGRRGGAEVVPVRFPLIGREDELLELERALDDASRGRGRLIDLVSEPGMGKSRLMEEVRDRSVVGSIMNSLPQCGRTLNGDSSRSITGSSRLTAGQSCFHVKWIATDGCR